LTRLSGEIGSRVWPMLPEDQKERVLGQLGETIREVQRVPVGDLSAIEPGWSQFISARSRAVAPGISALVWRRNTSTGWTRFSAKRRR
jgi:hypothetical protein